jgi:hypothetical protein
MNISKAVVLNPVEPSPLSFRAPLGMETQLNVSYYNPTGAAASGDVAGQLQLTGRTTARTLAYLMPATDIANGRARAYIPAGDLSDVNGYRLRLVGTVNGARSLLAIGTVVSIPSAGFEDTPADLIDRVDLVFTRGEAAEVGVKLWDDSGGTDPFDLATATLSSNIYESSDGNALVAFTVTVVAANEVTLTLTAEQVDALPDLCWWSLVISQADGATTLCQGTVTVRAAA